MIADTPTHTAAGVAVKLQQLQRDDEHFDGMSSWRPAAFRTALAALGRGTLPTIEDPVLALKREWEVRYQLLDEQRDTGDDSDEARQPFYDRLQETEDQILRTQATTPAGVAVKLTLWARLHCTADEISGLSWNHKSIQGRPLDLGGQPVLSALLDLERMAGEGVVTRTVCGTAPAGEARSPIEQDPDNAVIDLESALTDLDSARQALSGFLEDHMQNHHRLETAYCILNTLDQAEHRGRAAWKVLWEARPLHAGNRDKPPLKAVKE